MQVQGQTEETANRCTWKECAWGKERLPVWLWFVERGIIVWLWFLFQVGVWENHLKLECVQEGG